MAEDGGNMKIIKMPRVSMINKSILAFWRKKEGDRVERGESLFDIETDKATISARSPYTGILTKILVKNGYSAKVGEPVAYIEDYERQV